MGDQLTIIVPAYNEAESIGDTVRSLQNQTVRPDEIIVVDDGSSDNTGEIARSLGATVMRPPENTGSKAGAQTFALHHVKTPLVMAIDADTVLERDAIEKIKPAIAEPGVAAACGFVLPRHVKSIWERGRYVEYMFAFTYYKPLQDYYGKPLISSGCFSIYKTNDLLKAGGWSTRTMAEDMDLTWTFYQRGYKVRFVPEAVCYPIEPHDMRIMRKQLKRWSHGFLQNVRLHWKGLLKVKYLPMIVTVGLWDAIFAAAVYLIFLPLFVVFVSPWFLLGYVIDAPVIAVPVIFAAVRRREVFKALASLPAYFVLRLLNSVMLLKALFMEFIMRRPLLVYEKGH